MSTITTAPRERANRSAGGGSHRWSLGQFGWVWVGLLGVVVVSALLSPGTLRPSVLSAALPFAAVLAIAAVGQTLVVMQRGLDLSVAGTMSLSALTAARLQADGRGLASAFSITLIVCVLIGVLNSLMIVRLAITPLVATLAVGSLLEGATFALSNGSPISTSDSWTRFTQEKLLGLPNLVLTAVALVAGLAFISTKTVVGRRFSIVGGSAPTGRAAGIRVTTYQLGAYVGSAVCAGMAGVLLAGYTGSATPDLGTPYLLAAIAAVAVGGTPFTGGRGSMVATAAGALLLAQLGQLTFALGAPASIQMFVQAGVLLVAVIIPSWRSSR
jgi:ribose transport system permease protein